MARTIKAQKATIMDLLSTIVGDGTTFASFIYENAKGERAKHTVILGASTTKLYERDLIVLREMLPTLTGIAAEACEKIIASREKSLAEGIGQREDYTNRDTYVFIKGVDGVKVHKESGDIHVVGLVQRKRVIVPGVYKKVNSRPETIARQEIESKLPSAKFRQYKLTSVQEARLRGKVLNFM